MLRRSNFKVEIQDWITPRKGGWIRFPAPILPARPAVRFRSSV